MEYLIVATVLAIVILAIAVGIPTGNDEDRIGTSINTLRVEDAERRRRLIALNQAYTLAKEELGEEPTIEQILLTRDTLEDFDGKA